MLTDTIAIRTYFGKLGLDIEIADIYLALHAQGPQTISQLSRSSGVERTRIYRLIDQLMASNLIEVESHYKRGVIKAAPITNLHILINEKEHELKNLQDELGLIEQVLARNSLSSPAARVQFYRGPEGIRQILWNQLRARTPIIGQGYRILDEPTGRAFMERWAAAFEEKQLHTKLLINDEFVTSWFENKPKVKVSRRIDGIEYNLIASTTLHITHSCAVYDNVVASIHWKDGELFGIETYSQELADTQRTFYAMLWPQSKPETRF
ncbi:MAG TPA: helix-turn-helix domain-containing protein [Candidatus Saccharimonadales bacterium]|nr:helix-turn-helix domain-containing protein [Candidatus Saccharimonadales bacterium]